MSKGNGFGKFILFCAAVGAAAAGVYYYLSKRDAEIADSFDDDDFEDDDEESLWRISLNCLKLGVRMYPLYFDGEKREDEGFPDLNPVYIDLSDMALVRTTTFFLRFGNRIFVQKGQKISFIDQVQEVYIL